MFLIAVSSGFLKLGLLALIMGSLIMGLVTKLRKLIKKNKKAFFIYTLAVVIAFALVALLADEKVLSNSPLNNFISFQVLFLLLGSVHVFVLRKFFANLAEEKTDFWPEFLYTIVITIFGLIGFLFVVQFFKLEYSYLFLAAAICFLIPFMIVKVYEFALVMPIPVYNAWEYPMHIEIKDPKEHELKNPKVISFEFNKSLESEEISNFRLKAPEQMEFGKLFYFFINDYNERHPEEKIIHLDKNNSPFKWIFYSKPNWMGNRQYYDFNKTIEANGIKEDDLIICQRAE